MKKNTLSESIESLIKKEIDAQAAIYTTQIANLQIENVSLKARLSSSENPLDLKGKFKTLKPETIEKILLDFFPVSFYETGDQYLPDIFLLHVKFYNNRFQMYDILDALGITYPEWYKQVILPHEWNKEQLKLFIKTIDRHCVCNGCYFKNNIRFWYQEHHERLVSPEKQMTDKMNYDEIPWQFVLKNPLWQDTELITEAAKCIKLKKSHSEHFLNLLDYNQLNTEQVGIFIEFIDNDRFERLCQKGDILNKFIKLNDPDILKKIGRTKISIPDYAPNEIRYERIKTLSFSEAIKYIHNCDFFSETEKLELISKQVKKEYSDIAILDRLMQ